MATKTSARPLHILREHVTALEAAIALALADPKPEPVHRLRTSTRRIEAQLELLRLLPDLPDHAKSARAVRKLLKKLRRAAGSVRDLDVQRKLLKEQQIKAKQHTPSLASRELRKEAGSLRRKLKRRRSIESRHLLTTLTAEQRKLVPALEHLLEILSSAEDLRLSPTRLSQLTLSWYQRTTPAIDPEGDPDTLHAIRKSAKLARYIAEPAVGKLSSTFEVLQQAGGAWHDLLTLAHISEKHLGLHSPLTQTFIRNRDTALEVYRQALLKQ